MKGKFNTTINVIINYAIPIAVIIIIYIFYRYYRFIFMNVREKFTNNTKLCNDNSCGMGCEKPKSINDSCPATIYKDIDGNCHRKCPFICPNKDKTECKYDECCVGCGYTKIPAPCELAGNEYENDKTKDDKTNEPSANKDENTSNNSNSKSKNLNNNMTNIEHNDIDFKGWSPFVKKWPCDLNVTGTFTECGPPSYNSCGGIEKI